MRDTAHPLKTVLKPMLRRRGEPKSSALVHMHMYTCTYAVLHTHQQPVFKSVRVSSPHAIRVSAIAPTRARTRVSVEVFAALGDRALVTFDGGELAAQREQLLQDGVVGAFELPH